MDPAGREKRGGGGKHTVSSLRRQLGVHERENAEFPMGNERKGRANKKLVCSMAEREGRNGRCDIAQVGGKRDRDCSMVGGTQRDSLPEIWRANGGSWHA